MGKSAMRQTRVTLLPQRDARIASMAPMKAANKGYPFRFEFFLVLYFFFFFFSFACFPFFFKVLFRSVFT